MIHRIVQAALRQRFLVLMLTGFITVGGILSFQRMPVDAYPDLASPQVELITQWPGHAAEEVERLVTLPLELEMNGVPHMVTMRSISLYGLSDLRLTFEDNTDDYLARQIVFERLADAELPTGVTASMAPLFSPSGLVYRYVLESPDRSPQELKTIEDWVVERAYRSVPGVADDSGLGGQTAILDDYLEVRPEATQRVGGLGSHLEVVVDDRGLSVEQEARVREVRLEQRQQRVEQLDEPHAERLERRVPLAVPVRVGNDRDGDRVRVGHADNVFRTATEPSESRSGFGRKPFTQRAPFGNLTALRSSQPGQRRPGILAEC